MLFLWLMFCFVLLYEMYYNPVFAFHSLLRPSWLSFQDWQNYAFLLCRMSAHGHNWSHMTMQPKFSCPLGLESGQIQNEPVKRNAYSSACWNLQIANSAFCLCKAMSILIRPVWMTKCHSCHFFLQSWYMCSPAVLSKIHFVGLGKLWCCNLQF